LTIVLTQIIGRHVGLGSAAPAAGADPDTPSAALSTPPNALSSMKVKDI
jgi:hypothetical protein